MAGSFIQEEPQLASYRNRIDATLASIIVERTTDEGIAPDYTGHPYHRFDISFSGAIDGIITKEGPLAAIASEPYGWLYDSPDVTLPQEHLLIADFSKPYPLPLSPGDGNTSPRFYAKSEFRAEDGAGMTIFCPAPETAWNGKLFLVQRGAGAYPTLGPLIPRSEGHVFTPGLGQNTFLEIMIDRGYAVAWCRKDQLRPPEGVSRATLSDGTLMKTNHHGSVVLLLAMAEFAQNFIHERLGRRPTRTYYLGHSSGAMSGRLVNYTQVANVARSGRPIIDGFINDDAGAGLFMPIAFRDGEDVLFKDPSEREGFVPQIDTARQLYNPLSALEAKRENARLLRAKGLSDKHRYYEIRGVSHFDAGMARTVGSLDNLDIGGLMESLIDLLDTWVDKGAAPTPSKADMAGFEEAVALPEVAYPLGVHYAGPPGLSTVRATQSTSFAPFDGASPEPESTATETFVGMNGNGIRERRETVTQAWRRLSLLKPNEEFDKTRYVALIEEAANGLVKQGLLPSRLVTWYRSEAERLLNEVELIMGHTIS